MNPNRGLVRIAWYIHYLIPYARGIMQSPLFEPKNLPQIEPAGPLSRAIFEEPMVAMIGVGLLGMLLLLAFRTRGKTKYGLQALGLAALISGGLYLTSYLVHTDREMVSARARELVQAVAVGDQQSMQSLMGDDVQVQSRFANAAGKDRVITLASSRVPGLVEGFTIPEISADLPGPRVGRTMIKVRAQSSHLPTTSSWWMVHWERADDSGDKWVAVYIEPIWIQGIDGSGGN